MKFLSKSITFLMMVSGTVCAQERIRVTDAGDGTPLPSVDVYFPDLKTHTTSNANGYFRIEGDMPSVLVQVSCIGYKTWLGALTIATDSLISLEPAHFDMQEVVISGESSKLQGENVLNVAKMALKDNPEMQGLSLAQQLGSVAGVNVLTTGAGIGKPVIRGLSGNRVAVFAQGVRVENQQWGDEHGLGLDENGYEQVEVIKGPASLLYGSDALGGVLYFADERFARENSVEADLRSAYSSNTNGWRSNGAFKLSQKRFHWNVFGGYTTHEDYSDGAGNRVDNSRFHTTDLKTTLGYTGKTFVTSLKYGYLSEHYGLTEGDEPSVGRGGARIPGFPYQPLTTHLVSSENTFFFANQAKLKANVGYLFNSRKEFEAPEDGTVADGRAALDMNLGTLSYSLKWYSPTWNKRWTVVAGSQGMFQRNVNSGEEMLIPDATTADAGIFAMTEYHYARRSYFQLGIRFDGRKIHGQTHGETGEEGYFPDFEKTYGAVNFSAGIFQQLGEHLSLRTALSSGFRAPNMFELLSDGVHEGTMRYETGNEALKTENSYQADIALAFKSEHLECYVNPYFNYIRDYIFLQPTGEEAEELPVYHYSQAGAMLYGGETGFHLHPHPWDWLHLEGAYSNTFGRTTGDDDLPLMPAQQLKGTIRATLNGKRIVERVSVYLQEQYVFAQNLVAAYELPTPAYNLVAAGLSLDIKAGSQRFIISATVSNLLNEKYFDHLSRYKQDGILNMGRNMTVRMAWEIGK